MTYDELETQLLEDYRERFTERYKGGSMPWGEVEDEWVVQADPEALQDWIRARFRDVRDHTRRNQP